jgi:opacity protein-like surface antigen
MKMIKSIIGCGVMAIAMYAATAFAATPSLQDSSAADNSSTFYVGAQIGYANMNYDDSVVIGGSSASVDDDGFAGRIAGGYNFTPNVAFEVGYVMLPKVKADVVISGVSAGLSFEQRIFDMVVKGTLPMSYGYNLYGKAGLASVHRDEAEVHYAGSTARVDNDDTKVVPVLGAGVGYHLADNVIADVSYMHYFSSGDLEATDFIGAGVSYQFG